MNAAPKKTGRRPGDNDTRGEILDVARGLFAAKGFRGATYRAIAQEAGVDQGLIRHYFGDKAALFDAALVIPAEVTDRLVAAFGGSSHTAGERLSRAYLGLWEDPGSREQMLAIARSALSNEDAMVRLREILEGVLRQASAHQGAFADPVRVTLAMSHLVGTAYVRHLTRAPGVRDLPFDELVARVAPAVQLHLDGTPGAA